MLTIKFSSILEAVDAVAWARGFAIHHGRNFNGNVPAQPHTFGAYILDYWCIFLCYTAVCRTPVRWSFLSGKQPMGCWIFFLRVPDLKRTLPRPPYQGQCATGFEVSIVLFAVCFWTDSHTVLFFIILRVFQRFWGPILQLSEPASA